MSHQNDSAEQLDGAEDDPAAVPTLYIGLVGCLLTVIAILICHWVYYAVDEGIEQEVFARDLAVARELQAAQESRLVNYERAKQQILQKYGK